MLIIIIIYFKKHPNFSVLSHFKISLGNLSAVDQKQKFTAYYF
ncbi:hypothetical protein PESP_b0447 [Pseudoalteromonas espejiana DSM 9414]|nr:hypothetical protein PESP_b0447 [Pseudoalteromonas espejiana DSM 9414]